MARTAATATGSFVGACPRCGTRYYAATAADRGYCGCRAGVVCDDSRCLLQSEGPHDHPQTAIQWKGVVARTTSHVCDDKCLAAEGDKCACSCGGANHGHGLVRFERGLPARAR